VVPALADELLDAGGFRLMVRGEGTEVVVLVDRSRALLAARRERGEFGRRYGGDGEYEQHSSARHGLLLSANERTTSDRRDPRIAGDRQRPDHR